MCIKKVFHHRTETKKCQFPGCMDEFEAKGKTKYCREHQKQEYKKILYQRFESSGIGEANMLIDDAVEPNIVRMCDVKGCDNTYEIEIIPGQQIYSKYCSEHRNRYKREYFIKQWEIYNE